MPKPRANASPPHDPLIGVERLIVDGSNLLHAIADGPAPAPAATLIGRIRAVIPPGVRIELLFDGAPEPRVAGARIASGVSVRHSGRTSADTLALRLVTDATGGHPDPARAVPALLVVTDDGHLARELRHRGAGTIGTSWLVRRLARPHLSAPSAGRPKPPPPRVRAPGAQPGSQPGAHAAARPGTRPGADPSGDPSGDDEARVPWRPGRGATAKTGNPKRSPRHGRQHRSDGRPG
jgi:hypothetical protein